MHPTVMKTTLASLIVTAIAVSASAPAALVLYTDRAAWEAALAGAPVLEDFNSITTDTLIPVGSTTIGTITITRDTGFQSDPLFDVPTIEYNPDPPSGIDGTTAINLAGISPSGVLDFVLPVSASAFGIDTNNFDIDNDPAWLSIDGFDIGQIPLLRGQLGFIGVIATTADDYFTTVSVRGGGLGTYALLDNLAYLPADGSPIPEPGSFVALGGLLGAGLMQRSRRRKSA